MKYHDIPGIKIFSNFWKFHKNDVTKQVLGMIGNADGRGTVAPILQLYIL